MTLHLVSTGDDTSRLERMEEGFRRVLGTGINQKSMRLGQVSSLRIAYHNAARLIGNPEALIMFTHQDVEPVSHEMLSNLPLEMRQQLRSLLVNETGIPLWWRILQQLSARQDFGVAGVAGTCEMQPGKAWWQHDTLSGMVMHRREEGIRVNAYGRWSRVVTVDGLCMICKAGTLLADPPKKEEGTHFHFYDHDICISAHKRGLSNWTIPLLLLHDSGGAAASDAQWETDQSWFEVRYRDVLPVSVNPEPLPGFSQ